MSLFKVCNWWFAQCADLEDNYDAASLLCTRFGLKKNEKDYIVVGSHSGCLSIFYPQPEIDGNGKLKGYQPTDLLLESQFEAPILGILAGVFSGSLHKENTNQLAILHPNSLATYNLMTVDGVTEHGNHFRLLLHADHKLERPAYAFCKGNFGQVKGREFLCIIHLDGTLRFYEQDGISYECYLPGPRPLPSSIVYCQRTDSFLRFNSSWELECFTYQDLSQSAITNSHAYATWSVCLGEGAMEISIVQTKEHTSSIMILGERNLICINDMGQVEFILKLDYSPKCFHCFVLGYYWEGNARLITAIVSESSKLYIYENSNIIWAAQLDDTLIAIQRSNLDGLPGGIVTLSENGRIHIGYLGSEPFVFKVPPTNMNELNLKKVHKELAQLEEEIRQAIDFENIENESNQQTCDDNVQVQFKIDSVVTISDERFPDVADNMTRKDILCCSGSLSLHTKIPLVEVQMLFDIAEGVRCSPPVITLCAISANTSHDITFYAIETLHIHSAKVSVLVSTISEHGVPRVIHKFAFLPLGIFFKSVTPQKNASIKVTFSVTSKTVIPKISTFFPEFQIEDEETQALGFEIRCPAGKEPETVTVILAKNTNRIRIQSDCLEIMALVIERIFNVATKDFHFTSKNRDNSITDFISALPVLPSHDIMKRIDSHNAVQENIRKQTEKMDALWRQFKLFQRSLLAKTEDESMDGLLTLIDKNYDDLIAEGDKLIELRQSERKLRCNIACALSVAKIMISCMKIDAKLIELANSALCLPSDDWIEVSWEEAICPGIDMLNYYEPLSRKKSAICNVNISHDVFEYDRFRRHFLVLFDRLCRLAKVSDDNEDNTRREEQNISSTSIDFHSAKDRHEHSKDMEQVEKSDWVNSSDLNQSNEILGKLF